MLFEVSLDPRKLRLKSQPAFSRPQLLVTRRRGAGGIFKKRWSLMWTTGARSVALEMPHSCSGQIIGLYVSCFRSLAWEKQYDEVSSEPR